jgi:hypothetical protein
VDANVPVDGNAPAVPAPQSPSAEMQAILAALQKLASPPPPPPPPPPPSTLLRRLSIWAVIIAVFAVMLIRLFTPPK